MGVVVGCGQCSCPERGTVERVGRKVQIRTLSLFSTRAGLWLVPAGGPWLSSLTPATGTASGATFWPGAPRHKSLARWQVGLFPRTHTASLPPGPGTERLFPACDHTESLSGLAAADKFCMEVHFR